MMFTYQMFAYVTDIFSLLIMSVVRKQLMR